MIHNDSLKWKVLSVGQMVAKIIPSSWNQGGSKFQQKCSVLFGEYN